VIRHNRRAISKRQAAKSRSSRAQALLWFQKAIDLGNHNFPWFQRDKNFASLRGDPDYQRLMSVVASHWKEYKRTYGEQ
jgi:hypothetical protein